MARHSLRAFTRDCVPSIPNSIPNIPLVPRDAVPLQQQTKLILIRPCPVMLLLIRDVCPHLTDIGLADGECAVTVLPVKLGKRRPFLFDPFGLAALQFPDQIGDRHRPMQNAEDVNMILHNADDQ